MPSPKVIDKTEEFSSSPFAEHIIAAIPAPVWLVNRYHHIIFANPSAEDHFGHDIAPGLPLHIHDVLSKENPIDELLDKAMEEEISICDYGVTLHAPKARSDVSPFVANVTIAPCPIAESQTDNVPHYIIMLQNLVHYRKFEDRVTTRRKVRSLGAMASMLGHEVKNPLSGIRGAAQLLGRNRPPQDQKLANLICQETDRIVRLINKVEVFSDPTPDFQPLNIHEILHHACQVAQNGFACHHHIKESYDPSLPSIAGDRDQLVQLFLNLLKNAAEACDNLKPGQITVKTAYQRGVRLSIDPQQKPVTLPIMVSIEDNGCGIPGELTTNLFDPFVTIKQNGSGLGLALAAKIVHDHNALIDFHSRPGSTVFCLYFACAAL